MRARYVLSFFLFILVLGVVWCFKNLKGEEGQWDVYMVSCGQGVRMVALNERRRRRELAGWLAGWQGRKGVVVLEVTHTRILRERDNTANKTPRSSNQEFGPGHPAYQPPKPMAYPTTSTHSTPMQVRYQASTLPLLSKHVPNPYAICGSALYPSPSVPPL